MTSRVRFIWNGDELTGYVYWRNRKVGELVLGRLFQEDEEKWIIANVLGDVKVAKAWEDVTFPKKYKAKRYLEMIVEDLFRDCKKLVR